MASSKPRPSKSPRTASFLASIEILVPGEKKPFVLKAAEGLPAARSLEAQAMRWSYVLRTRERWLGKGAASQAHENDAVVTMQEFGIGKAQLDIIAKATRVVVRMPYGGESEGWAGRIFPWEYVIAAATRQQRQMSGQHFTVMRELSPRRAAPLWQPQAGPSRTMLFVQSAPGGLRGAWEFDEELARVRRALVGFEIRVLTDPTLRQLQSAVAAMKPDLVHLSGFGNLQGLRALRGVVPSGECVETDGGSRPLAELLSKEQDLPDGMLLAGEKHGTAVVGALQLAQALSAGGKHCAYFIAVSLENSAARTAALLVGERAALSAVGFQDAIENALVDFFFELVYTQLSGDTWDGPLAFEQAWLRARREPNATRATGIAFWAGASLIRGPAQDAKAAELRESSHGPQLQCTPEPELNYAVLHNKGELFKEFVITPGNAKADDWLGVDVELHLGAEPARFSRRFLADKTRFDMTREVLLPLTASLMRALQEAVNSTLLVKLSHNEKPLSTETYRLRLLPVDQWRDNDKDGQWLPSFVLPRDAAVGKAVEQAQRYVRVLRDNPVAGFEGYQAAPTTEEELLREVDLQVQAIWSTLVHEWRLGYINPPPSYSSQLDSQRLRTPSTIFENRSGTCIDLALLFAACLELIDVYPVIFLLNGHALPGYWRHQSFHAKYQTARDTRAQAAMAEADDAPKMNHKSSESRQKYSWQSLGGDAWLEISELIETRQLVPIETVRLTEHCGFVEAIEAGIAALSERSDFHSVLDIVTARVDGITPLPIYGGSV